MRLLAAICASLSLAAAGLLGGGLWVGSEMALRPGWYQHRSPQQGLLPAESFANWAGKTHDPERDFSWPFETVEFPTDGDATLRGWWIPGSPDARVGVVTVHGAGADRRDFLRHLPVFHEAGYPVLMFDCREHGISDGDGRGVSFGVREHADVIAAARYARRRGQLERVAVVGTSQGGASAILAAARDATIDAIVSENPFTDLGSLIRDGAATFDARAANATTLVGWIASLTAWRVGADETHAPIEAIEQIAPRPVLLMHGTADRVIPVAHTHALYQAAPFAELWIAEGARHAALFDAAPDQWRRRVLDFLERSVGPALSPRTGKAGDRAPRESGERTEFALLYRLR
ncbi:MAG: alpha/beta fold hydrolase [Myxococcota bacterium]|nr:alpha/beta fold hydrolase [Myxococcota bacterium]